MSVRRVVDRLMMLNHYERKGSKYEEEIKALSTLVRFRLKTHTN